MRTTAFTLLAAAGLAASASAQRPPLADIGDVIKEAELPPSEAAVPPPDTPAPVEEVVPAPPPHARDVADAPAAAPSKAEAQAAAAAEAAWEARREGRRVEVNAEEAPLVARLNREIAERHAAAERRYAAERVEYERRLAEIEAETRAADRAHRAALEAHARDVERRRADHERRVALCLAGEHQFCAPEYERR